MATIVCPYNGVNVLRVCAQLRVEGSTYLLRAVFPTLIPLFTCCIHEQMFWEISWCTLFKFSLLAYLSVYPLIYILQYIAYTLHTVSIHYTATCLHTHQSSMSAYEKNLQKIAICPHSLELSAVYIRLHNAVRQLQAGSPCHQQAICQAGLYDCMYCQNSTACTTTTMLEMYYKFNKKLPSSNKKVKVLIQKIWR